MKKTAPFDEMQEEPPYRQWSAEEAQRLREENPSVSPWWVIGAQAVVGLVVALAAWGLTGRQSIGLSAAYGAAAVLIPAAVFARGLTGRFASLNAGTAAMGFMLWEMVKIALTVAMLVVAPKWVPGLSWPALLVGLVVTMKVYWLALAYVPKGRRRKNAKLNN